MATRLMVGVWLVLLLGCGAAEKGVADLLEPMPELVTAGDVLEVDSADDTVPADVWPYEFEPVVFAIVSDIHLDGTFEDSIAQKVVGLLAKAAAATPAPEFIAITGDLTDQMAEPVATDEGSIIDALQKVMASSPIPVEPVLGNHDYYATGDAIFEMTADPLVRTQVFQEAIGLPPWHYTVHGGMKFVHLNSLYGPLAADSLGLNGSLGEEQLAWLDQVLADGVPAILFLHHPPSTVLEEGELTLEKLIAKYNENVLAVFVGHIHVWASSEISGVPVYITSAGFRGEDFHHVRVDPIAGTVEILNLDSIDYGETVEVPCEPQRDPGLTMPEALAGAVLVLQVEDGHIEPMGLGSYLRELVSAIPMAVQLGATGTADSIPAAITVAKTVGDGADGIPAHLAPVAEGVCAALEFQLDGPCFTTTAVDLPINLGKVLGFPLPPGWQLRAELQDLVLTGALVDGPAVELGVLRATIDFNLGSEDLKSIIVSEYCAGKISSCSPGQGTMPACPTDPGPEFFDTLPPNCDVSILGIGLRTIFDIFASVPGLAVELDANFDIFPATESSEPTPGTVAPELFVTCPSTL